MVAFQSQRGEAPGDGIAKSMCCLWFEGFKRTSLCGWFTY